MGVVVKVLPEKELELLYVHQAILRSCLYLTVWDAKVQRGEVTSPRPLSTRVTQILGLERLFIRKGLCLVRSPTRF